MKSKNFARSKGIRGEYIVRNQLRSLGYKADRVPLSGSAEGFKGDVIASKDGHSFKFEVKCRKDMFQNIYTLHDGRKDSKDIKYVIPHDSGFRTGVSRFDIDGQLIAMSQYFDALRQSQFEAVFEKETAVKPVGRMPKGPDKTLVFRQLLRYKNWLGEADFLVLKINGSLPLYIKYWK